MTPSSSSAASPRPLAQLFFGTDRNIRFSVTMWLTSVGSYALYGAILLLQVRLGFTPPAAAAWCVGAGLAVNVVFYVLLRSGWAWRRGALDAGLSTTQLVVGIAFFWAAYAVSGPVSGATLLIVSTHIVYAAFTHTVRAVFALALLSLTGLAATMLLVHALDPLRYPTAQQTVAFCYAALVILLISLLARHIATMHTLLRTRSDELVVALKRVQELATRDELTGTHNRRHLTALMETALAQHARSGAPLSLALLDIDLFKAVNDRHGHAAGDAVLRRFAAVVGAGLRQGDLFGRWGGEEFMALLPGADLERADAALARIRETLHLATFDEVAPGLQVSASIGVVELRPGETLDAAIERADQAMYRAKTGGRDRIVRG